MEITVYENIRHNFCFSKVKPIVFCITRKTRLNQVFSTNKIIYDKFDSTKVDSIIQDGVTSHN